MILFGLWYFVEPSVSDFGRPKIRHIFQTGKKKGASVAESPL